jgi:hypothetical protein
MLQSAADKAFLSGFYQVMLVEKIINGKFIKYTRGLKNE